MTFHHSQKAGGEEGARVASVLMAKDPDELEAAYDRWAEHYADDIIVIAGGSVNQVGIVAAQVLLRQFPHLGKENSSNGNNKNQNIQVLDFGCGTGEAGSYLQEHSTLDTLKQLDGGDLSQGMLKQAAKRNVYRQLIKAGFTDSGVGESDKYDIVHAAGVFAPGQAPPGAFDDMLRITKRQGHVVFTVRCHYYDSAEGAAHKQRLEELVEKKQWQLIAKTEEDYLPGEGVKAYVFVMQKL